MHLWKVMRILKKMRWIMASILVILVGWLVLTFYVERRGPEQDWLLGDGEKKVAIIFDPDPFYNLDEQICLSFGQAMAAKGIGVHIMTVSAAEHLESEEYHLIVYCANTYNWRPDWAVTDYIEEHDFSTNKKPVVAITLGAGSTESSRKNLEQRIIQAGGKLEASYSLWLWRPNDETKVQPNVDVAVEMAYQWGSQTAMRLQ